MTDAIAARENALLEKIVEGDEDAFIQLYRERHNAIYRFALQMSGSKSVAEDVTQEVFLALLRNIRKYDPERGPLAAYLYGMARNIVLDQMKRGRSDVGMADGGVAGTRSSPAPLVSASDPLGDLTRGEALHSLRQAVLALPAHYREVVVLCDLHEMNYEQAAQALQCAVGTVRSRLHRARELLLRKLGGRSGAGERFKSLKPARCDL